MVRARGALSLANDRQLNLKPHPGVFLSAYLGAGTQLGTVKVPVNGPLGGGSCGGNAPNQNNKNPSEMSINALHHPEI